MLGTVFCHSLSGECLSLAAFVQVCFVRVWCVSVYLNVAHSSTYTGLKAAKCSQNIYKKSLLEKNELTFLLEEVTVKVII